MNDCISFYIMGNKNDAILCYQEEKIEPIPNSYIASVDNTQIIYIS